MRLRLAYVKKREKEVEAEKKELDKEMGSLDSIVTKLEERTGCFA